jgi:dynein heavy chain 1
MFEVQDLRFATLATVSRCGMVWFSEDVVTSDMLLQNFLQRLRYISLDQTDVASRSSYRSSRSLATPTSDVVKDETISASLQVIFMAY